MKQPIIFITALFITGCAIKPYNIKDTNVQHIDQWQNTAPKLSKSTLKMEKDWWIAFDDKELTQLIEEALNRSPNIYDAILKLKLANINYQTQKLSLTPDFSSGFSSGVSKSLKPNDHSSESYSFGVSSSYELDLWQKVSDSTSAKLLQQQASQFDLETARLMVSINIAKLYWQIINTQHKIQYADSYLTKTKKIHNIAEATYQVGKSRQYDLILSQQSVVQAEKQLFDYKEELAQLYRQLNLALDYPPENLQIKISTKSTFNIPKIPAGLPADIIKNRPDIAAGELRLRAGNKELSALVKSFYPPISLSSSIGSSSLALHDLLSKSVSSSIGLAIGLPFIQWNRMRDAIASGNLQYDQSLMNFRSTIYNAYQEVEVALSLNTQIDYNKTILTKEIQSYIQLESINKARFTTGTSSIKDWIESTSQLELKKLQLIDNQTQKLIASTALIQAVGGLYIEAETNYSNVKILNQ